MSRTAGDAAAALWTRGRELAGSAPDDVLSRAADCVLAALVEAVASAREDRIAAAARALAPSAGPATVAAGDARAALPEAIVANAFLIHATLSDDAYRLALHPGLAVVPAALARAEETGASGEAVLRAVAGGYEVACRLADALLPQISERGLRVTAVVAPVAVAATIALLDEAPDGVAVEALRLAGGAAGGPLRTVDAAGDGWSLQPALATGAGVAALRAAEAGMLGAERIVEAVNGLHGSLCGGEWPGLPTDDDPRILRVTFKEHPVAMYGQAIFDAVQRGPFPAGARSVVVHVPPFAAGYGRQDSSDADSVGSVAGIARKAIAAVEPDARPEITVIGDPGLGPLDAWLDVDGWVLSGSGDTSGWGPEEVAAHALRRAGDRAGYLVRACQELARAAGVAAVWEGVRAASR